MKSRQTLRLLGQRIRLLREGRGWSQEELANRCSRHFTYIGRIERGLQNVTVTVLYEIATALGVEIAQLLTLEKHSLLDEWKVISEDVVEAVDHGFRAKVDVKGKLAELMLHKELIRLKEAKLLQSVEWLDEDDKPDFVVRFRGKELTIQCKNVRSPVKNKRPGESIRIELQKTRNAKDGTNTRGYKNDQFDVLSACLFNQTGKWEFLHIAINKLATRPDDPALLKIMQQVPPKAEASWRESVMEAIKDRLA